MKRNITMAHFKENYPLMGENIKNLKEDFLDFSYLMHLLKNQENIAEDTKKGADLIIADIALGYVILDSLESGKTKEEDILNVIDYCTNIYTMYITIYEDTSQLGTESHKEFIYNMKKAMKDHYEKQGE
jgi:hypothetical protein